jgi:uncharacterized damage-inducible protein DinB
MAGDLVTVVRTGLATELEELRDAVGKLAEPLTDEQFWVKPLEPGNSIGHLILHLTGNLNHFVGGQLGKSGYVRDRDREFTEASPPSRSELLANLDTAVATFRQVVEGLSADDFAAPHPEVRFGNVFKALQHLLAHFALHRGQMSYIVRLVQK